MAAPAPSFAPDLSSDPNFAPSVPANPRVGRISPQLRTHVHHLVETYPAETVRVIREWMAEGGSAGRFRH